MLDMPARRLAAALLECIEATDGPTGFIAPKHGSPHETAMRTLHDLRLVVRHSIGWRATPIGRALAEAWRT